MKVAVHFFAQISNWLVCWLILGLTGTAKAQAVLPLQPDKLRAADETYQEAIDQKDTLLLAEVYYKYGKVYRAAGDYLTAQKYFLKNLRILALHGDSEDLGRVNVRLAEISESMGDYAASLRYTYTAIRLYKRIQYPRGICLAYGVINRIMFNRWLNSNNSVRNKTLRDSLLHNYLYVKRIYERLNDTVGIAEVNGSIGTLLTSNYDRKGLAYLHNSLISFRQLQQQHQQAKIMILLAEAYINLGEMDKAYAFLLLGEKLYSNLGIKEHLTDRNFTNAYIHYYKAKGDYKQVAIYLEKLQVIQKREAEADRQGAISRLNIAYETEKKEKILQTQRKELGLQAQIIESRNRLLIGLAIFLAAAIAASIAFFRLYRQKQRLSQRNAELVKEQNHRVKNNLQVLSSLLSLQSNRISDEVARQAVEESQLRVETMAILQRRLYDGDQLVTISLPDFLMELVEIVLQTFGFDDVETEFAISSIELPVDHALRIGLIVNELTTNACKYAFAYTDEPVFTLTATQQRKTVTLTVADNGPGLREPFQNEEYTETFGLRLIQLQVEQLNGTYSFSVEEGTHFSMQFTL